MSISLRRTRRRSQRLELELTQSCNHHCAHCYNVWATEHSEHSTTPRAQSAYPSGQLPTRDFIALMEKAVHQTGAQQLVLTGGEPLLRDDAMTIIARACALAPSVQIITNGSRISPEVARDFARLGVRAVQLTLLSADPSTHDRLKGAKSFEKTVRAALDLREAGVTTHLCFVALRENAKDLQEVLELGFVSGVKALSYNRMSPAGGAIKHLRQLLPTVAQIEHNLEVADRLGQMWKIPVVTAMPIMPCLIRLDRFRWIKFGFCSAGSPATNFVIDALGQVRSCNLSSTILGNLVELDWQQLERNPYLQRLANTLPPLCRHCTYARTCRGGCKESAAAAGGSLAHPDPLLQLAIQSSALEYLTTHERGA